MLIAILHYIPDLAWCGSANGGRRAPRSAQTSVSPGSAGLANSVLSDFDGPVGIGAQSLLVAPRPQR